MGKKKINAIVYLSTKCTLRDSTEKENRQLRYIEDYARANNIHIKDIVRRDVLGRNESDLKWRRIAARIRKGEADAVLLAGMACVSTNIPEAFAKIGQIVVAGGRVYTVDEGELYMKLNIPEVKG